MATIDEFQHYAEECMRSATVAKTEEERKAFLNMARTWTEAALRVEGVLVPTNEDKPEPTSH